MPAETTVQIEIDEKGQISVGMVPPEAEAGDEGAGEQQGAPAAAQPAQAGGAQSQMAALMAGGQGQGAAQGEEGAEADYMKPVRSIDEALAVAKQLLTQGQGPSPDEQMAQGFGKPGAPPTMMGRPG